MTQGTKSTPSGCVVGALLALILLPCCPSRAEPHNRDTDWFKEAKYGVFMHFLPGNARQLEQVSQFDVKGVAKELAAAGAGYFVITLGQNSGFFISPNSTYDRYTGYAPGERCATRDLPLDLFAILRPRGIKLMLYLPCQAPNRDARAQRAFGLRAGPQDQPLSLGFARKWARVIREWSDRYGDKVAGWWFDGGYQHIGFNESIAQVYAAAVRHGNPRAIVTFNPGVKVVHYTEAEDYTAGELNQPLTVIPTSRWLNGSQWHALTYLGSNWARRDTRYSSQQWADWVKAVAAHGGVVTLDTGPNWNPDQGPVGLVAPGQLAQLRAIKTAVRGGAAAAGNPAPLK
jgi:Alpha-L-fucosidase